MKQISYMVEDIDPEMAKEVLQVQDACNLSGVVMGLKKALDKLWRNEKGTEWVNQHPIVSLYINKLAHLNASPPTGLDIDKWQLVHKAAEKKG